MVNLSKYSLRQVVGAAVLDIPRIASHLAIPGGWMYVRNRDERLLIGGDPEGAKCDFKWTTAIHACDVFPPLGSWMMRRAFEQWPIRFATPQAAEHDPEVTFILPIRGVDRLPQLLATIDSILGQEGARVECVVVEQSNVAETRDAMPGGVRYFHLPHPEGDPAWRKCWAYNHGAMHARAKLLVFHDGDIVVPSRYGAQLVELVSRGYEAIHLQRFLFYLGEGESMDVTKARRLQGVNPVGVRQNWKGGTVAIQASAFHGIGGFDERFVGWTGEDIEFYDRCATLNAFAFGSVPFVHLWHPDQPEKHGPERERNLAFFSDVMRIPAKERIARLRELAGERRP